MDQNKAAHWSFILGLVDIGYILLELLVNIGSSITDPLFSITIIFTFLMPIIMLVGIILGFIGLKSSSKNKAIFGLAIPILTIIIGFSFMGNLTGR